MRRFLAAVLVAAAYASFRINYAVDGDFCA